LDHRRGRSVSRPALEPPLEFCLSGYVEGAFFGARRNTWARCILRNICHKNHAPDSSPGSAALLGFCSGMSEEVAGW
jgi:hypothetical protein